MTTPHGSEPHHHHGRQDQNLGGMLLMMHLSNRWQQMTPEEKAANDPFRGFFGGIAAIVYGIGILLCWAMVILLTVGGAAVIFAIVQAILQAIFGGGFE